MEDHHRETIQKNYSILVQECNIDSLLPLLEQKKVFPEQTIAKYRSINDRIKRKQHLFVEIESRGPKAFSNLVLALHETGQDYLVSRLDPTFTSYTQPKKGPIPFQLPTNQEEGNDPQRIKELGQNNFQSNININLEPLIVKVTFSTEFYDQNTCVPTYSTHSKKRGAVLIINIIKYVNDVQTERKGAHVDGKNLNDLFSQMGFIVKSYTDLTKKEIEKVIDDFQSSSDIEGCDMIFVIVMGHGTVNKDMNVSEVIGIDDHVVSTKWIEDRFNNAQCKKLANVPKIFVYQMCRGDFPDYGTVLHHIENDSGGRISRSARISLRSYSDMLIAHSTLPGTTSHRDVYCGTWYIGLFCRMMMERAHNTHLEDIFKLIDNELARLRSGKNTMQTSMYTNIGFKTCYVHPGIYMHGNEMRRLNEASVVPEINDNGSS